MEKKEKFFNDKIKQVELEDLMYSDFYDLITEAKRIGKEIGFNEAMRWRDPREELPTIPEHDCVKIITKNSYGNHHFMYIYESSSTLLVDGFPLHKLGLDHLREAGDHGIVWRPL